MATEFLTIGHSTRPIGEFVGLLRAHGVERVVDVRSIPRSLRNPQYEKDALKASLLAAGIEYIHHGALGGLRKARPDSPNGAWRNASFRGYADHMQTMQFEQGLLRLFELAREKPTAILCAEAVPWRCHRSMIADAAVARGAVVRHIMSPSDARPHGLNPAARVDGEGRITYPAAQERETVAP